MPNSGKTLFPETFSILPGIFYLQVVDFDLRFMLDFHNSTHSDLIYTLDGEITLLLPNQLRFSAGPGEILMMPGHTLHRDLFKPRRGLKALVIAYEWPGDREFFDVVDNNKLRRLPPEILSDLRWIFERMRDRSIQYESCPIENSWLHTALLLMYSAVTGSRPVAQRRSYRRSELLEMAKAFIRRNYGTPLTRKIIAAELGVSVSTLSRAFMRESGFTLAEYLTEVRLEAAKRLLRDSGRRIEEVAMLAGFSDPGYFARVFRQKTGGAPRDFR